MYKNRQASGSQPHMSNLDMLINDLDRGSMKPLILPKYWED